MAFCTKTPPGGLLQPLAKTAPPPPPNHRPESLPCIVSPCKSPLRKGGWLTKQAGGTVRPILGKRGAEQRKPEGSSAPPSGAARLKNGDPHASVTPKPPRFFPFPTRI